jgi:hypothetical protein
MWSFLPAHDDGNDDQYGSDERDIQRLIVIERPSHL